MDFKSHLDIKDKHAFLGASKWHWINYSEEKLKDTYAHYLAIERGTKLHELAKQCISLGVKLPTPSKKALPDSMTTLSLYVNDAIGYKMTPEQPLYFSDNCFGTADAISFRKGFLRIHDLKTGKTNSSFNQLKIYAALFSLEYDTTPDKIELRIYQNGEVKIYEPDFDEIDIIINKIIDFDKTLNKLKGD